MKVDEKYQSLFDHMSENHGLILTITEMDKIIFEVLKMMPESSEKKYYAGHEIGYKLNGIVYVKKDKEQKPHIVVSIDLKPFGRTRYFVKNGAVTRNFQEHELSNSMSKEHFQSILNNRKNIDNTEIPKPETNICDCGKPAVESFDPCCSMSCWEEMFENLEPREIPEEKRPKIIPLKSD